MLKYKQKIIKSLGPFYPHTFKYNPYLYYYYKFESGVYYNNIQRTKRYIPYIKKVDLTFCLEICIKNYMVLNNMQMLDLLIENGANVDGIVNGKRICSPIFHAINVYDNDNSASYPLKCLLKNGANVNLYTGDEGIYEKLPLLHAIYLLYQEGNKYRDCIKLLIEHGADVNKPDINGNIPLFSMCMHHWYIMKYDSIIMKDVFNLLIKSGAHIDMFGEYHNIPLMLAVKEGNDDVVKILIENGANVNIQDISGYTALMYSLIGYAKQYKWIMSKLLVDSGANVNIQNHIKETAFMLAAKYFTVNIFNPNKDWYLIFELFIKSGVDIYHKNIYGDDVYMYARNTSMILENKQDIIRNYVGLMELKKILHMDVLPIVAKYLINDIHELKTIKRLLQF